MFRKGFRYKGRSYVKKLTLLWGDRKECYPEDMRGRQNISVRGGGSKRMQVIRMCRTEMGVVCCKLNILWNGLPVKKR